MQFTQSPYPRWPCKESLLCKETNWDFLFDLGNSETLCDVQNVESLPNYQVRNLDCAFFSFQISEGSNSKSVIKETFLGIYSALQNRESKKFGLWGLFCSVALWCVTVFELFPVVIPQSQKGSGTAAAWPEYFAPELGPLPPYIPGKHHCAQVRRPSCIVKWGPPYPSGGGQPSSERGASPWLF